MISDEEDGVFKMNKRTEKTIMSRKYIVIIRYKFMNKLYKFVCR